MIAPERHVVLVGCGHAKRDVPVPVVSWPDGGRLGRGRLLSHKAWLERELLAGQLASLNG